MGKRRIQNIGAKNTLNFVASNVADDISSFKSGTLRYLSVRINRYVKYVRTLRNYHYAEICDKEKLLCQPLKVQKILLVFYWNYCIRIGR